MCEHAVVGRDVLSWVNPEHPGYAYSEAAGLLVRWLAQRGLPAPPDVVDQLRVQVETDTVGRDGCVYAFDTAVVLAGLEALDSEEDPRWTRARARLAQAPAVRPQARPRWSTVAGPHMLKAAVGVAARARRGWRTPMLPSLAAIEVQQEADGRIVTPPHPATYVHAHAYATEGLLALRALGQPAQASIDGAVAFLAALQRNDGGLPAWSDGGPARADATAQAVRLFVLHDRVGLAEPIARGLAFLERLSDEHGVVRYEADAGDRNTWCTLFAAQARAWALGEAARVEDLL